MIRHIVGLDSSEVPAFERSEMGYGVDKGGDRDVDRLATDNHVDQLQRRASDLRGLHHVDVRFDLQLLAIETGVPDPTNAGLLPDTLRPGRDQPPGKPWMVDGDHSVVPGIGIATEFCSGVKLRCRAVHALKDAFPDRHHRDDQGVVLAILSDGLRCCLHVAHGSGRQRSATSRRQRRSVERDTA